jgi:hypothetical protein
MIFTDIKAKIYFLTKTNSNSFPIANLVIEANNAMDRVASLIRRADARWRWDDENQIDLPVADVDLVSGQQDYTLEEDFLSISRMEIKDQSGFWHTLKPFDELDVPDRSLSAWGAIPGIPTHFDVNGQSVTLYPAPNYSQAASLAVYYTRGPVYFTSGDTTKEPGFNSLYHDLVPLWVAYNYVMANGMIVGRTTLASQFMAEIQRKEDALQKDYAYRGPGRPRFFAARRSAV